jgi:hypothetical protein
MLGITRITNKGEHKRSYLHNVGNLLVGAGYYAR